MNVRNCRKCGRLFNYAVGPVVCTQCKEALEGKFKEVKEYIQNHPGCGQREVCEECDVENSQIQQWLREERLEFSSDSMITLQCDSCGTSIRSGRYCDKCKGEMLNGFKQASSSMRPKPEEPKKNDMSSGNKMRFGMQ